MIKIGDRVEILNDNASLLEVGSQHIVTEVQGWKGHDRRIVAIDQWLFPTDCLRKVEKDEG